MSKRNYLTWVTVAFLASAVAGACSSENNDKPSKNIAMAGDGGESDGGSGATTGGSSSNGGSSEVAGTTSAAGVGLVAENGGTPASGSSGVEAIAGSAGQGASCTDSAKNCYSCAATTNEQLLNHCTDAKCVAYDNTTLTKIVNGQLPALP